MPTNESGDTPHPLTGINRLIHEPARLLILNYLDAAESADFVFLMRVSGLTWGNLSSHMAKLEQGGYITVEKQFLNKKPHSMARLTPLGKQALDEYRQVMKKALVGVGG